MSVETILLRGVAEEVHGSAQDVLRTAASCGIVRYPSGRIGVIWPGLVDHWISQDKGELLGCVNRTSTVDDVLALLEGA